MPPDEHLGNLSPAIPASGGRGGQGTGPAGPALPELPLAVLASPELRFTVSASSELSGKGEEVLRELSDTRLTYGEIEGSLRLRRGIAGLYRAMGPENLRARKLYVYNKAMEYGAEGVIIESMKFCEYWGYERAQDSAWLTEGFALPGTLPVCQIERDYTCAASGQLRTRFQAFVESLEIKRIQAAEQKEGA